jgi:Protein of unknown function (DUF1570)
MSGTIQKLCCVLGLAIVNCAMTARAADFMFRANVDGQILEGQPLHWSATQMLLLGRDGQLYEFNPKSARDAAKTGAHFASYSPSEMKISLEHELGNNFEVSSIRHFVVVHPRGERDLWAERFDQLYDRFNHYFSVRGFQLKEPAFPLVAIVFRDHDEYMRHAAASGTPMHPNTLGHYDPRSNRVFLYDVTAHSKSTDWSENASTIIHEATHQMAFNVGVHRRFAVEPKWLVEGLATMFEAPGVWNAQYDRTQSDRINRGRLNGFREYVAKRRSPGSLATLLTTDNAFQSEVDGAYAEAWALSFYLSETQPRAYAELLARTARRPAFSDYSAVERMADFQSIFGTETKIFETKFLHYMQDVK